MSIIKNLEVKIKNGEAKLNEEVYVYQRDRGVELKLKLNMIEINSISHERSTLFEVKNIYAGATILKPNGDVIGRRKTIVKDNTITFTIDKDFTDEVDEIGIYKIQFHLFDDEDNRMTIPPIQFEVKELLGLVNEEDIDHQYGIVDISSSDECMVVEDEKELDVFFNGKYVKTIWSKGDLITSAKLNKIENAIGDLDGRFYIGKEPLHIDPIVWVDVPDLDNPYPILDSSFYGIEATHKNLSSENIEIQSSSDDMTLREILKSLIDRVKVLEKKIEFFENNN